MFMGVGSALFDRNYSVLMYVCCSFLTKARTFIPNHTQVFRDIRVLSVAVTAAFLSEKMQIKTK